MYVNDTFPSQLTHPPSKIAETLILLSYIILIFFTLIHHMRQFKTQRSFAHELKHTLLFSRFLSLFSAVRAIYFSILVLDNNSQRFRIAIEILQQLSQCLFFSISLFQSLFWIDIVNSKVSLRSKRIWKLFFVANTLFYSVILSTMAIQYLSITPYAGVRGNERLYITWIEMLSLCMIALTSLLSCFGLCYSMTKLHRRVIRVMRQQQFRAAYGFEIDRALRADSDIATADAVSLQTKMNRALLAVECILGTASVMFLLRSISYLEYLIDRRTLSAMNGDLYLIIVYGLGELIPCTLFSLLMWKLESDLIFPPARNSFGPRESRPARVLSLLHCDTSLHFNGNGVTEKTPLLSANSSGVLEALEKGDQREMDREIGSECVSSTMEERFRSKCMFFPLESDASSPNSMCDFRHRHSLGEETIAMLNQNSIRSSSLSLKLGTRVLDKARINLSTLIEKIQNLSPTKALDTPFQETEHFPKLTHPIGAKIAQRWLSFQCFNLQVPYSKSPFLSIFIVLFSINSQSAIEIGRTEIARVAVDSLFHIFFHLMSAVLLDPSHQFEAIVYGIRDARKFDDLSFQWRIGQAQIPTALFSTLEKLGHATLLPIYSCSAPNTPIGELIVRCEANARHSEPELNRHIPHSITRLFIYRLHDSRNDIPQSLLIEEELIESVYTWEIPYQLLQLVLSKLVIKLKLFRQETLALETPSKTRIHSDIPAQVQASTGVSMLSDMIYHIQDDAMWRKKQKWRSELIELMEAHIALVEQAILRYSTAEYDGLTFKPSTKKADPCVSFLALNLHQQLLTVGSAAPTLESDVEHEEMAQNTRYTELMNVASSEQSDSLRAIGDEDTWNDVDVEYESDLEEFMTYESVDQPMDYRQGKTFTSASLLLSGSSQDLKAVPLSASSQKIPHPSRRDSVHLDVAMDLVQEHAQPFSHWNLYGTTTVGAFAAHVFGFKRGGLRQMQQTLYKIQRKLKEELQKTDNSELTIETLTRKYHELSWHIERRLEVAFCQALSALVTCFQQTLYVHLQPPNNSLSGTRQSLVQGVEYLEMITQLGFLFSMESLLSTYRKEAGMLGDMDAVMRELEQCQIRLCPVKTPEQAAYRVSLSAVSTKLIIELPIILADPHLYVKRSMHRMLGQDGSSGAVYLNTIDFQRLNPIFSSFISVIPVLFSQGINEMQTVANTVGKASLQREINFENMHRLNGYFHSYWAYQREKSALSQRMELAFKEQNSILQKLQNKIFLAGNEKCMDILSLSSNLTRSLGGGRVTCCKSAKDRTAMSVTLEEANLLLQSHNFSQEKRNLLTDLLRIHGVRRENARKNIGKAQYCFSALQNYMLPSAYQCPPGTGGGKKS